jgi:hypothetical protein
VSVNLAVEILSHIVRDGALFACGQVEPLYLTTYFHFFSVPVCGVFYSVVNLDMCGNLVVFRWVLGVCCICVVHPSSVLPPPPTPPPIFQTGVLISKVPVNVANNI